MLSVANVRSASGAASYFAADNYYANADADRSGQWIGAGAAALGLAGQVDSAVFDKLLQGELPNGTRVGRENQHRAGTDLTFSLPKSWSVLALVGGDKRIIEAYREAVIETLQWAEKNAAETRLVENGKVRTVQTGNLTVALFQHDTNRNQEPNLHFHGVVANVTRGADGKWRTLKNDRLWSLNTLLNSMTMARFRLSVERLGYEVGPVGKHGNFEAAGFTRDQVMAFSTRRQEVLDARRGPGLEAGKIAALDTRSAKQAIADRGALLSDWQSHARAAGLDLPAMVEGARALASQAPSAPLAGVSLIERGMVWLREFAEKIRGNPADPLIPAHILKQDRESIAAAQATASAVRHLSQREAAFPRDALLKSALDFGLPITVGAVEKRVDSLVREGELVRGTGEHKGWLTSRDALATEHRILAEVEVGRDAVRPILESSEAGARVKAVAAINYGIDLNAGQEAAARLILSSTHRTIAIQGVAGAGKSSVLKPVSQILGEEGKEVIGLAVQNTLVQMLERDTGIPSMTLARLLKTWAPLLENPGNVGLQAEAKEALGDRILVLDEASMVSNRDKERLVALANLAGALRLVLIGDTRQLGAVDAGKPFDLVQKAGIARAEMTTNLRGRDPQLRLAQAAAQTGDVHRALGHLRGSTIETTGNSTLVAAEQWLSLSPQERDRTAIYASGRALRSAVNDAVQTGLKANGELGKTALELTVLSRVNATREELRYLSAYRPGMVLEVRSPDKQQHLPRGEYKVASVDEKLREVRLSDAKGKMRTLRPSRIRPGEKDDRVALFEEKRLSIHDGDRIRWTENDHRRGLFNADQARIEAVEGSRVALVTSSGLRHELERGDPMLRRLDLAYALNAHMAQGLTSDRGIAVMDSRERNLANQQTFLVTVTRLRDHLTLVVDNADKLGKAVSHNTGEKVSALEVTERLREAAAKGLAAGATTKEDQSKQPPELAKERTRPFEIGL
ncbi:conjugative relaxase-like TrwC/TraI family protein [Novosphingobium hassiacum]|uniref:Conjugative relaxase-like TrwC/TraI family protein n=1 Tax=Novosphingobium hassiacum TaxID=173676 RepID=A0A7W6A3P4_9SPHN|nr:MobF family relaxase [Novosphingobium hassiacum]MBB3862680.1 conjugative relaxase-like TrwC/TraI family protein [Novosphingobium hassiacum]